MVETARKSIAPPRIVPLAPPLLEVTNLKTWFPIRAGMFGAVTGHVKAVDGVSFTLKQGETLGLVGESGCGKTTVGRSILRLVQPTGGRVLFNGNDVLAMRGRQLRELRRRMQIIFQDPYSSLNPRQTVGTIVGEALTVHKMARGKTRDDLVARLLDECGLDPAVMNRYPHEFSGGQRQRIGIARALALNPAFIVCDEPVSALDVSIQAQIINLLQTLKERHGLSYLFIAHNLHVVEHISDRVAVMYLGHIVETATRDELYKKPMHPYTKALLSANPEPDPTVKRDRIILQGNVPSPANPPSGCHFHTRCPAAQSDPRLMSLCKRVLPPLRIASPTHTVRCHLWGGDDGQEGPAKFQPHYDLTHAPALTPP